MGKLQIEMGEISVHVTCVFLFVKIKLYVEIYLLSKSILVLKKSCF
jgi:hypothetical protein